MRDFVGDDWHWGRGSPPPDPTPDPPDPTPPDPTPPDPTPPPLPPPAPMKAPRPNLPPCNDTSNNRSRFFQQLPGLTSVAKQLDVPTNFIVGLSSYESGWFDNHNFNLNNLWGLTQAGHNTYPSPRFRRGMHIL